MKRKHIHRSFSIFVVSSFYMMPAYYTSQIQVICGWSITVVRSSYKAKVDFGRHKRWEIRYEFSDQNPEAEHTNSAKCMKFLCDKDPRCSN